MEVPYNSYIYIYIYIYIYMYNYIYICIHVLLALSPTSITMNPKPSTEADAPPSACNKVFRKAKRVTSCQLGLFHQPNTIWIDIYIYIYIDIDICFPKKWYQTNSKMHIEISTNVLLQAIPVWLVNSKRSRFIDDFPLNCQAFLNKRRFLLEWDSPKSILDWDFPQPSSYRGYPQFRKPPKLKRTH